MRYLILLFCVFTLPVTAQTFEQADSLYQAQAYQASADAFSKVLDNEEGDVYQYYTAACAWAQAGDTIRAIDYLRQAAAEGYRHADYIERDTNLNSLHFTTAWPTIVTSVEANLTEYEKDYDHALKDRLERIYLEDQVIRQLWEDAQERFGKDSKEMKYFWEVVGRQDSINELSVIEIIEERGWPATSLVGDKANRTVWLVIQHADVELQEKYLPLLKASVVVGESSGSNLALLEDRILMYRGEPQIYGSQVRSNSEASELEVYEILDPENVNQRRAEVGLGSLESYLARFGIEWAVPQSER